MRRNGADERRVVGSFLRIVYGFFIWFLHCWILVNLTYTVSTELWIGGLDCVLRKGSGEECDGQDGADGANGQNHRVISGSIFVVLLFFSRLLEVLYVVFIVGFLLLQTHTHTPLRLFLFYKLLAVKELCKNLCTVWYVRILVYLKERNSFL
ncbi:hypothetical protein I7I50_05913 [Histoplasma capsulatum G186AR]|uniref:Transmembrane protein n=1 Tax=Ajellomyces capsulatus TaxID=5037 RepID=A0A8H8D8G5_AJECA|nr:hypothetical protein I7I52_04172 [Histoplasma capsulatum]QSS76453.1 hypothetical protein I7I50_05913 [Histoplasma capsulatum G186AR]